jgi:hypothetical protein
VCSPLTTYSRYALQETRRVAPHVLAAPLCGVIGAADWWLRHAELDRAVSLNNWLLSTNLYPATNGIDFGALVASCQLRRPRHSVWFRSLDFAQHADWLHALMAAGFDLTPTRQVYLFRDISRKRRSISTCAAMEKIGEELKPLVANPSTAGNRRGWREDSGAAAAVAGA